MTTTSEETMPTVIPIPALEAWAIQHRLGIRQQAEEILQDGVRQVLERVGAPDGWVIRMEPNGSMFAVPPQAPP